MENETNMGKDGQEIEWLAELDLQTKYKDNPEQLKSVLEKADRREHPTRGVTLYADVTSNTLHSNAIEVEVGAKRKATSSEVAKATEPSKGATTREW